MRLPAVDCTFLMHATHVRNLLPSLDRLEMAEKYGVELDA